MKFESKLIDLVQLFDGTPSYAMDAIHDSRKSEWILLKGSGELVVVDFGDRSVTSVAMLEKTAFDHTKKAMVHVSGDGRFAAVANTFGTDGVVVDLSTGRTTMILKRDDYHVEHCALPLSIYQAPR